MDGEAMTDALAKQEDMDGTPAKIEQAHITIKFQLGPVKEFGVNGCQIPDVVRVLIDRINGFNREGAPFRCRENSLAVTKLEEALHWLGASEGRSGSSGRRGT